MKKTDNQAPPPLDLTPTAYRKLVNERFIRPIVDAYPIPGEVHETTLTSSVEDTPITIMTPAAQAKEKARPTIFYLPGNAFVAWPKELFAHIAKHLAVVSQCQVIILPHHLAPEYQWPTQHMDTLINFYIAIISSLTKIDKDRIAIAGYSSGGNLAIMLAIFAGMLELPIKAMTLVSPFLDLAVTSPIFQTKPDDPIVQENFLLWAAKNFSSTYTSSPFVSAAYLPAKTLKKYIPHSTCTFFVFGEHDVVRQQAEEFSKTLDEADIRTRSRVYPNWGHVLWWQHPPARTEAAIELKNLLCVEKIPRVYFSSHQKQLKTMILAFLQKFSPKKKVDDKQILSIRSSFLR